MNREVFEVEFDDGSCYVGELNEDSVFHGSGRLKDDFGCYLKGTFQNGTLVEGESRDIEGNVSKGKFQKNGALSEGTLMFLDGGEFRNCRFDDSGNVHDDKATYVYPDKKSFLKGSWEHGKLKRGRFDDQEEYYYCHEPEFPGLSALQKDPYEEKYVYVKKSKIDNAGEGLFAKVDLPKNFICSFYGGKRVSQEEVNERDWSENSNVVLLDNEDVCIDVPKPFDQLDHYCATLGHKGGLLIFLFLFMS